HARLGCPPTRCTTCSLIARSRKLSTQTGKKRGDTELPVCRASSPEATSSSALIHTTRSCSSSRRRAPSRVQVLKLTISIQQFVNEDVQFADIKDLELYIFITNC